MQFHPKELVSKTFSKRNVLKYFGAATLVGGIRLLLEQKAQAETVPPRNAQGTTRKFNGRVPSISGWVEISPPTQYPISWINGPISAVEDAKGRLWFLTQVKEGGSFVNRVFYRENGQTIRVNVSIPANQATLLVRKQVGSQQAKLVVIGYQETEFYTSLYQLDIPGFAF